MQFPVLFSSIVAVCPPFPNCDWIIIQCAIAPVNCTQCWASYFVKVTSYILHITCN